MDKKNCHTDFSIEALKTGNQSAFEMVFRRFYKPLCFFAARMIKDLPAAEDIAENSFIKLWNNLDKIEDFNHVKYFLYKVARNACLDHIKVSQRTDLRERLFTEHLKDDENNFFNELIRAEVMGELHQAIKLLPRQCGKIMSLSYIDGLKNPKIAEQLNISIQTVKNQKSRGIKLLQSQFSKYSTFLIIILVYISLI